MHSYGLCIVMATVVMAYTAACRRRCRASPAHAEQVLCGRDVGVRLGGQRRLAEHLKLDVQRLADIVMAYINMAYIDMAFMITT